MTMRKLKPGIATTKRTKTFPVISVQQPWADLIVNGRKDIENRKWSTRFRGNILIQAGKKIDRYADLGSLGLVSSENYHPVTMAIIGMARITDCVKRNKSAWFDGPFGFVLTNAVRFKKPIPQRGQLGIFQVPISQVRGTSAMCRKPGCFRK